MAPAEAAASHWAGAARAPTPSARAAPGLVAPWPPAGPRCGSESTQSHGCGSSGNPQNPPTRKIRRPLSPNRRRMGRVMLQEITIDIIIIIMIIMIIMSIISVLAITTITPSNVCSCSSLILQAALLAFISAHDLILFIQENNVTLSTRCSYSAWGETIESK